MIQKILIANRGEIACRIMRTCRELGIRTVAVYSTADADARHVQEGDEAILIGDSPAVDSYLAIDKVVQAAVSSGADAIHPGYGFLAENSEFAQACVEAGLLFIGPTAETIEQMGNKRVAKELAAKNGVPILPSYAGVDQSDGAFSTVAQEIGYPIMVKAAAGGGGKGMRLVAKPADLTAALVSARREGLQAFGSDELMLEKALLAPRHIEVQIFGDTAGNVVHLGERECSVQRRHQKIIEEAPAVGLSPNLREQICQTAVRLAAAANYVNAGTVEFLLEGDAFYFLEMNTRIQVEHPVTEMVTGQDLVAWQIAIAEGKTVPLSQQEIVVSGHAIEARLYAEDPENDFLPSVGEVLLWQAPELVNGEGFRVDGGLKKRDRISVYYDPMIAKVITYGQDRQTAVRRLAHALSQTNLLGVVTNQQFLGDLLTHGAFLAGGVSTSFVADQFAGWRRTLPGVKSVDLLLATAVARYFADSAGTGGLNRYWRAQLSDPLRYRFADGAVVDIWPGNHAGEIAELRYDDRSYQVLVECDDLSEFVLRVDGRRLCVTLAQSGDVWWAGLDGVVMVNTAVGDTHRAMRSATDDGRLCAPMQGIVLEVLVAVGDAVEPHQPLVKLEAMKMEHTVKAVRSGIVADVCCLAGEQVESGAELVVLA